MAHLKNGNIRGKLGNTVGYEQHGKNFIRKAPQRTAPATEGELKNRFMMQLLSSWLKPLTPFLRKGFRNYSWNFEGFSAAFSVNYKEALQKDGFDSVIDPMLLMVSSGELELSADLQVNLAAAKQLEFSWDPTVHPNQGSRDTTMLLAYDPEKGNVIYELNGAPRHKGEDRLSLALTPSGTYHVYIAFASEEGIGQSDSRYLGAVGV